MDIEYLDSTASTLLLLVQRPISNIYVNQLLMYVEQLLRNLLSYFGFNYIYVFSHLFSFAIFKLSS